MISTLGSKCEKSEMNFVFASVAAQNYNLKDEYKSTILCDVFFLVFFLLEKC